MPFSTRPTAFNKDREGTRRNAAGFLNGRRVLYSLFNHIGVE